MVDSRYAFEVVNLLRTKSASASELIDVVEARVSATDDIIHATPIRCFDRARSRLPVKGFLCRPPLLGLPILIKDTNAVEGVLWTRGSPHFATHVATYSGPMVRAVEESGAVVVGKTNTPEFAAGSQTFNPLFGTTPSPWDVRATSGGSSGGACAALAACQCWLATGSDLGGSLRTPAAFCGVVGFRVSPGLVPRDDSLLAVSSRPGSHAVNGPLGRCVRDVGLLLDAMAGAGNEGWGFECPAVPAVTKGCFEAAAMRGAARAGTPAPAEDTSFLQRGVGYSLLGCEFVDAVEVKCRAAFELLAAVAPGGGRVLEEQFFDEAKSERAFHVLRAELFAKFFGPMIFAAEKEKEKEKERERETEKEAEKEAEEGGGPDPPTIKRDDWRLAELKPAIVWNARCGMCAQIKAAAEGARADCAALLEETTTFFATTCDVVCTPATLDAAFDAGIRYPTSHPTTGASFDNYLDWMRPALVVTPTGCPALVLPCGALDDGRPVGVQLIGAPGHDEGLLEVAALLEALLMRSGALDALNKGRGCPVPREGVGGPLFADGPRSAEEEAAHHSGAVSRWRAKYL